MNATAQSTSSFARIAQPVYDFWTARNPRERNMLAIAIAAIVLALVYLLLIQPALSGREQLQKNLPTLRQQVAQMQAMTQELENLPEQPSVEPQPATREGVQASLLRKGLEPQNLSVEGGVLRVQLPGSSFAGTLAWLDEMQKNFLFTVSDANIVAQAQPDTVDATLTLQQRKNAS